MFAHVLRSSGLAESTGWTVNGKKKKRLTEDEKTKLKSGHGWTLSAQ